MKNLIYLQFFPKSWRLKMVISDVFPLFTELAFSFSGLSHIPLITTENLVAIAAFELCDDTNKRLGK